MGRNLDRRVETVLPVLDPVLADVICDDLIDVYLRDNVRARVLRADGTYERRTPQPGERSIDVQQTFLSRYRAV